MLGSYIAEILKNLNNGLHTTKHNNIIFSLDDERRDILLALLKHPVVRDNKNIQNQILKEIESDDPVNIARMKTNQEILHDQMIDAALKTKDNRFQKAFVAKLMHTRFHDAASYKYAWERLAKAKDDNVLDQARDYIGNKELIEMAKFYDVFDKLYDAETGEIITNLSMILTNKDVLVSPHYDWLVDKLIEYRKEEMCPDYFRKTITNPEVIASKHYEFIVGKIAKLQGGNVESLNESGTIDIMENLFNNEQLLKSNSYESVITDVVEKIVGMPKEATQDLIGYWVSIINNKFARKRNCDQLTKTILTVEDIPRLNAIRQTLDTKLIDRDELVHLLKEIVKVKELPIINSINSVLWKKNVEKYPGYFPFLVEQLVRTKPENIEVIGPLYTHTPLLDSPYYEYAIKKLSDMEDVGRAKTVSPVFHNKKAIMSPHYRYVTDELSGVKDLSLVASYEKFLNSNDDIFTLNYLPEVIDSLLAITDAKVVEENLQHINKINYKDYDKDTFMFAFNVLVNAPINYSDRAPSGEMASYLARGIQEKHGEPDFIEQIYALSLVTSAEGLKNHFKEEPIPPRAVAPVEVDDHSVANLMWKMTNSGDPYDTELLYTTLGLMGDTNITPDMPVSEFYKPLMKAKTMVRNPRDGK